MRTPAALTPPHEEGRAVFIVLPDSGRRHRLWRDDGIRREAAGARTLFFYLFFPSLRQGVSS